MCTNVSLTRVHTPLTFTFTHSHTHTLTLTLTHSHTHTSHSYSYSYTLTLTLTHTPHSPHTPTLTYRDIIDFLCIKHNLFLNNDLDKYHVTATRSGSPVQVNLDLPSTNYTSCLVEIRSTNQDADAGSEKEKKCVS